MAQPWQLISTSPGGTVAALASVQGANPQALILAATPVGVRISSDAGRTWAVAGNSSSVPFASALAPSPHFARDRTLFAGGRDGLYRSRDAGASWAPVLTGGNVQAVITAVADGEAPILFVGTDADGVLRSEDDGRSWASANPGLLDPMILALALSPRFRDDRIGFVATATGIYRTRNAGRSWRSVDLGAEEPAVQCLAVSPDFAEDRLVLAGTEADGLLRSVDGGESFEVVPAVGRLGVTALAFSSRYPRSRVIAAATDAGVALCHDGGESWQMRGSRLGPVLSLLFVAADHQGEALLAGLTRAGLARSEDEGATWVLANEGLNARLLVGLTATPPLEAAGTTLFAGDLQGSIVRSRDGGVTWTDHGLDLEHVAVYGLAVSPDYAHDRTLVAATSDGLRRSTDDGSTWSRPDSAPLEPARTVTAGPQFLLAGVGSGKIFASDDAGATWRATGPETNFGGAEIISLAVSPAYARDRTLFAGTSSVARSTGPELVVWRSADTGRRWERWLVGNGADVLPLAVPPTYPVDDGILVGLDGCVVHPRRGFVEVRGAERRPMWQSVTLGDGSTHVTALATSPAYSEDRTIFAATSQGVFVSRDGGASFVAWSDGLQPTAVVSLAVSPRYAEDRCVYALGLGGTVWRRRDT